MKSCREYRGGFHIYGLCADLSKVGLEIFIPLPNSPVCSIYHARPVIVAEVAYSGGDRLLQGERRKSRNFRRKIVIRGSFPANGGNRKDKVSNIVFLL